jgi:hypothetical protein
VGGRVTATGRKAKARRWFVQCPAYSLGPFDQATAERRLAEVEALGACMFDHALEEESCL